MYCLGKGSWLGITRQGRFALLTNYRDPSRIITDAPSRGELVSQYLTGSEPPARYAQQIHTTGSAYNEIGRASCRERVCLYVYISVVAVSLKKNNSKKHSNKNT